MDAELWSVTVLMIVGALFLACLVYAGVTNTKIQRLKKRTSELESKVSQLEKKTGISN
jgi:outer membrane murein-binding lipoprotein Lpp